MATLTSSYKNLKETSFNSHYGLNLYGKLNSQNIANNQSNISPKVSLKSYDGHHASWTSGKATINGGNSKSIPNSISANSEIVLNEISYNVTHSADGTKTVSLSAAMSTSYSPMNASVKADATIPTIPRASSFSGGSGNIGDQVTINITRASSSFTHKIKYNFGNLTGIIATGVATSCLWTIPNSFYKEMPNTNSKTGTLICETYSGSTLIGTKTINFTVSVINSNPIFQNDIEYFDNNPTSVAITENNQHIIRNISELVIRFPTANPQNAATIEKYEITFNGIKKTSSTVKDISFGIIDSTQDLDVLVKVIDSRGNSTRISKKVIILDWFLPTANLNYGRINNYYDETIIKVDAKIASVNDKNKIKSIKYHYKNSSISDSQFSDFFTINNNEETTVTLDKNYYWYFEIFIEDLFGTTQINFEVIKGIPIVFYDIEKLSVGIGTFPNNDGSLEVGNTIYFNNENGESVKDIKDYLFEYEVIGTYEGE